MGLFGRGRGRAGETGDGDADARKSFKRGQREFAAGRYAEAAAIFREVVALAPDSPNSQFLLGAALFNAGDSKAAVEPLRRCLAMRDDHSEAHLALGVALGRLDEFDEAEDHLAKAASLGNPKARERLATVGADYCRRCARPAVFADGDGGDADIVITTPRIGMACSNCHTVLCGTCASGGRFGPIVLACPDCGGALRPLTG